MAQARVVVLNEVKKGDPGNWNLCFQWCRYEYGDGNEELGYRFIWRRPNGNLQAARGQARIPSVVDILELGAKAIKSGWGHNLSSDDGHGEDGNDD
ncbi:MAG TPA: hypothetical protein DD730_03110 [Desulfosporosinus sp.]|jgi:hypothetical protein|nr:hypothetical protein [Desulfosporosinus sp.]